MSGRWNEARLAEFESDSARGKLGDFSSCLLLAELKAERARFEKVKQAFLILVDHIAHSASPERLRELGFYVSEDNILTLNYGDDPEDSDNGD